jgi:1,4-alpha-glucan branching enzyme
VHHKFQTMVGELNALYRREPAMYEIDDSHQGFEWIDFRDADHSVILFVRFARDPRDFLVFCCNFTPVPQEGYRVGLPRGGRYREIFNSDADMFGGGNMGNRGIVESENTPFQGRPASALLTLPPLAVIVLKPL